MRAPGSRGRRPISSGSRFRQAFVEAGEDVTRLQVDDLYLPVAELHLQSPRECAQCGLGGAVWSHVRDRILSRKRTHVDDLSPRFAQIRQEQANQVQRPEHQELELILYLGVTQVLERPPVPAARIVDEHVEAPRRGPRRRHRRLDRFLRSEVQSDGVKPGDTWHAAGIPGCAPDLVPPPGQPRSSLQADPRTRTGQQDPFRSSCRHRGSSAV